MLKSKKMKLVQNINISRRPVLSQKFGFDIRLVRYEKIHNISKDQFDILSSIVNLKSNEQVLDAGAGYGSVTQVLLERNKHLQNVTYTLSDISLVQLKRAKNELPNEFGESFVNKNLRFVLDNIAESNLQDKTFDKIIAKMLIHEIKKEYQQAAIDEIYRTLKPGGKLIIWDVLLNDSIQMFIQSIIRKKDKLAGFHDLVENRYLFKTTELENMLSDAGFTHINQDANFPYTLNTASRLDCELKNDVNKLHEWNDFIRGAAKELSSEELIFLNYEDKSLDICLTFPKGILTAIKPL